MRCDAEGEREDEGIDMAGVRFEHVSKHYEVGVDVIRDLNLEVRDQELLVLVGPSGCGKSTALRLIAGLEKVSEGNLYIGDELVNTVPAQDRDVAMVFQDYALYPTMTVRDNLAFGLKMRDVATTEVSRRVGAVAETLGIAPLLGRKPGKLSGGQRQRVALGRAIVREPRVFLLDEPLSSLDAELRVRMRAEIVRLHLRIKATMIYVTHDQTEAMTMGDHIAVINAGEIQQLGTPHELYESPANRFVAGFIGSPAMNFFQARMMRSTEGSVAVSLGHGTAAITLPLTGQFAERAVARTPYAGREVVLGIRPEALHVGNGASGAALAGTVEVVEHLGSEQVVFVRVPGVLSADGMEEALVTARLDASVLVRPGDSLALAVDASRVYLFDPETGVVLV